MKTNDPPKGTFGDLISFAASLAGESDRGCALFTVAYIDRELEKLLRQALVANLGVQDEFLGVGRPLGSFSARIDLAYLLGLIGSEAHRNLRIFKRVRNNFGHSPSPVTFGEPAITKSCADLALSVPDQTLTPREQFERAAFKVIGDLHSRFKRTSPTPEALEFAVAGKDHAILLQYLRNIVAGKDPVVKEPYP